MGGHALLEKLATQLALNNNAFLLIVRDENGLPQQLYPIPAVLAESVYIGESLFLKFIFQKRKGKHLPILMKSSTFGTISIENDIFGTSPAAGPLTADGDCQHNRPGDR